MSYKLNLFLISMLTTCGIMYSQNINDALNYTDN